MQDFTSSTHVFFLPAEEEIETAVADRVFRFQNNGSFEPGYLVALDQVSCHQVIGMGVEHDRKAVPLHGNDQVRDLSALRQLLSNEEELCLGQKELVEPSRVREVGAHEPVVDQALDDEPVRPGTENSADDVWKEAHNVQGGL